MHIFISHSSKNKLLGSALVEFLTTIGIPHTDITFTSDTFYGIPSGENIFDWLKGRISKKPFVIYLLSPDYFSSVACLNEMGAAWIVESEHVSIFTPGFSLSTEAFQNSVLDPREMGFYLTDTERLMQFAEDLIDRFDLQSSATLISRACAKLSRAAGEGTEAIHKPSQEMPYAAPLPRVQEDSSSMSASDQEKISAVSSSVSPGKKRLPEERFLSDLDCGKLRDEEILFAFYAYDSGRMSFGVGWRAKEELERITQWEEMNGYGDLLSRNYDNAINRFEIRNIAEVSERTSAGNPRQMNLVDGFKEIVLDPPESLHLRAREVIQSDLEKKHDKPDDPLPF